MMDRSIWDILAIEFEPGLAKAMIAAGIALETIFLEPPQGNLRLESREELRLREAHHAV